MSVLNQVILGVLLMVTLIVAALMVRVYSKTRSSEPQEQTEHPIEKSEPDQDEV